MRVGIYFKVCRCILSCYTSVRDERFRFPLGSISFEYLSEYEYRIICFSMARHEHTDDRYKRLQTKRMFNRYSTTKRNALACIGASRCFPAAFLVFNLSIVLTRSFVAVPRTTRKPQPLRQHLRQMPTRALYNKENDLKLQFFNFDDSTPRSSSKPPSDSQSGGFDRDEHVRILNANLLRYTGNDLSAWMGLDFSTRKMERKILMISGYTRFTLICDMLYCLTALSTRWMDPSTITRILPPYPPFPLSGLNFWICQPVAWQCQGWIKKNCRNYTPRCDNMESSGSSCRRR